MCQTTDSYNKNAQTEQDHKLTVTETAQELGNAMAQKVVDTKDSVVDTLTGATDTAVEKTNAAKEYTVDKTMDARGYTADKIGNLEDSVRPPKSKPETKTIGERLGDIKFSVVDSAKNITSNIHAHPDFQQDEKKEEKDDASKPLGAKINDSAQSAKESLDQTIENAKQTASEKTKDARTLGADNLETLRQGVEPPRKEEPKSWLQEKLDNIRAGNDPHEDPKMHQDENKPIFS
ncbi:MAG: hypothetical protein SGILL_010312 [Bacillariaceae sp.]